MARNWRGIGEFFIKDTQIVEKMIHKWYSGFIQKWRTKMISEDKKRIQVSLTLNMMNELDKASAERGLSKSTIITLALEEFLKQENK